MKFISLYLHIYTCSYVTYEDLIELIKNAISIQCTIPLSSASIYIKERIINTLFIEINIINFYHLL